MKKIFSILALTIALQGCASLTEGTTQIVSLHNLPESGCTVQNVYVNPHWNKVQVKKSKEDLVVQCKGETKYVESSVSSAGLTSILFVDFGIVDSLTGAMWKYPNEVDFNELKKSN